MSCRMCGKCCMYIDNFYYIVDGTEEWCKARGMEIIQKSEEWLHVRIEHRCPQLTKENKCDIHAQKPKACREGPIAKNTKSFFKEMKLDWRKTLLEGCGYG